MGLSFSQIALIALVALLVIGPKKLPEVAKSLGKGYAEFKRTFGDLKKSVDLNEPIAKKNSGATASSATYKSRWEEQVESDETPEATVENAQTEQIAEPTEPAPAARAKRADLVKEEDSDGTNG